MAPPYDDPHRRPTRAFSAVQGGGQQKPLRTDPEWVALQAEMASRNSHAALQACDGLADSYDALRKRVEEIAAQGSVNTAELREIRTSLQLLTESLQLTATQATRAEVTAQIAEKTWRDSINDENDVEAQLAKLAIRERDLALRARELEVQRQDLEAKQALAERDKRATWRWGVIGRVTAVLLAIIGGVGTLILAGLAAQTQSCNANAAEHPTLDAGQGGAP